MKPSAKPKDKPINYQSYMTQHKYQKGDPHKMTNTRIGSQELTVFGGSFAIPNYEEFIEIYRKEVFLKGNAEYLTEVQLEKGALLVDVDLRHEYSVTTRQYTSENIADLVDLYLGIIKTSFQLDDDAVIPAYIFQKPTVNRVADDKLTKDGLHIIFGIACDHAAQQVIRNKVLEEIDEVWSAEELQITNSWDKVFDEGISKGSTNWQLIGSRKPGYEVYRLTGIFTATFDGSDQEFSTVYADASTFDMVKDIYKLSARYPDHYEPLMTRAFHEECSEIKTKSSSGARATARNQLMLSTPEISPLSVKTIEQLDICLKQYLDNISSDHYKEYEAYAYTMTLPPKYYGPGSYDLWFSVGCALRNISDALFVVWLAFSAQSPVWQFSQVQDLWDYWQKFDLKSKSGLTLRSIIYWSKKDGGDKYDQVRKSSLDYYIDLSLDCGLTDVAISSKGKSGATDWDIAQLLCQLKRDLYICASIKHDIWYQYKNHRWVQIEAGTSLNMSISTELRALYAKKAEQINEAFTAIESADDPKAKYLEARLQKVLDIYARLGRTNDKKNIMYECRHLFSDDKFTEHIDTNPHLLCCKNGVWDFKEKVFRDGKPEDYISMCTNLDYIPLSEKTKAVEDEISDFMAKLFPEESLREYMWDHLSSTLVGTALNQTFNNYLGGGRNGKSVLVSLMTKTLGEYKGELPLTAVVTSRRVGVGGLSPEIVKLKGKRYAVMQEPRQGDVLNEGILKELTSGTDAIQARGLFTDTITFIPQFKLVVCANILPEIKAQDHGTWRRIRVIPFKSLFTENPVDTDPHKPYQYLLDPAIDEKFDAWKTVFFAMLVDRVLRTGGLVRDCDIVLKASNEYKHKQDVITQFIEEKIVKAVGKTAKVTIVNEIFRIWHESNFGTKGPPPKEIHVQLNQMFGEKNKDGWNGIEILHDTNHVRETVVNVEDIDDPMN